MRPAETSFGDARFRSSDSGPCRLCGHQHELTKTHVPSKFAFNRDPVRMPVERVDEASGATIVELGRPQHGGAWGYWLCRDCNTLTGKWDRVHRRWQDLTVAALRWQWRHGPSPRSVLLLDDVDPGGFSRAIWPWMFAMDEELLALEPHVAAAVLDGKPAAPAVNVRMLMAVTTSQRRLLSTPTPRGGAQLVTAFGPDGEALASGVKMPVRVAAVAPPFVFVLVSTGNWPDNRYFDVGRWITEPAGTRRNVTIDLPVELTSSTDELPAIAGPDLRTPLRVVRGGPLPDDHVMLVELDDESDDCGGS